MIQFSRSTFLRCGLVSWSMAAVMLRGAAQTSSPDFQITPEERSAVIEGAMAKLNEIYVFAETAKKMEDAIRLRAAMGEYDAMTGAKDFARKLTSDLREISQDKHLRL